MPPNVLTPVVRALLTTLFAVVCVAAPGNAQDEAPAKPPVSPPQDTSTVQAPELPPGLQLIYTDPRTGQSAPVPGFSPSMLKSLQSRAEAQAERLYDLRKLNIEGALDRKLVRLKVTAWIEVTVEQEWVTVPFAFDNFQVTEPAPLSLFRPAANGNVTQLEEVGDRFGILQDKQSGRTLRFRGKGTHQLTLNLIGEVAPSNDRRRLRMKVPVANQSYLKLLIPELIDDVRLSTDLSLDRTESTDRKQTTLQTWGVSGSTELSWKRQVDNTDRPTTIRQLSPTQMKLDLTTEPPSLIATQQLQMSGNPAKTITLQFPDGFTDLSVSASTSGQQSVPVDVIERGVNSAVLEFETGLSGAVELTYNFDYPGAVETIAVRPPDLIECDSENAEIELLIPAGLQVDIQRTGAGSVKQKATESPSTTRASQVAYRLLAEDSELTLALEETTAFYSVAPAITFETDGNSLLMTASFTVDVLQGSVNSVYIAWPGYDEWQILNDYTKLVAGAQSTSVIPTQREEKGFLLEFPERQSREFVVIIDAIRDLEEFRVQDRPLSLPDLPTTTQHTSIVSLVNSDEHSMELRPADGLADFPALPTSRWPDSFRGTEEARTVQVVDTPSRQVQLDVRQQRSETRTQTVLNISLEGNNLEVSQVLSYDVRYRDIDEIRLNTPPGIIPSVRLAGETEPLQERSSDREGRVYPLPNAARGQFDLMINYFVSPDDYRTEQNNSETAASFVVDLPLVIPGSIEPTLKSIEVATNDTGRLQVNSPGDWQRIYSGQAAAAWMATQPVASVPVTVRSTYSTGNDQAEMLLLKSAIVNGHMMTSTTFLPTGDRNVAKFQLPQGCELVMTSVNGRTTDFLPVNQNDDQTIELRSDDQITKATVVIQHDLAESALFTRTIPKIAKPVEVSDRSLCLWLMKPPPGGAVIPVDREFAKVNVAADQSGSSVDQLLAALPLPFSQLQTSQILGVLDETQADSSTVSAFVGTMLNSKESVYVFTRQTILVTAAILGLLTYFLLASLRTLPMVSVAAVAIAMGVILLAFVPPAASDVIMKVLPGCLAAIAAAVLQRFIGTRENHAPREAVAVDNSTIFAIEEPLATSGQMPSAVPSRAS